MYCIGQRPALASLALASEEAFGFRCYTQGKLFMKTEKKKKPALASLVLKKKGGSQKKKKKKKKKPALASLVLKKKKKTLASLVLKKKKKHSLRSCGSQKKKTSTRFARAEKKKKKNTHFARAGLITQIKQNKTKHEKKNQHSLRSCWPHDTRKKKNPSTRFARAENKINK